nr:TIGR01841 family phasin [uncultured Cupriavidus sp.]
MPSSPTEQMRAAQNIFCVLATRGLQRLIELNLRTMKSNWENIQEATRKAAAAKDSGELLSLHASLSRLAVDKAQAYQRELFELAAAAQGDFAEAADAQIEESKRKMEEATDNATGVPMDSEAALSPWQSALSAGANFFETMQQSARRATEVAEGGSAARSNATAERAARNTKH